MGFDKQLLFGRTPAQPNTNCHQPRLIDSLALSPEGQLLKHIGVVLKTMQADREQGLSGKREEATWMTEIKRSHFPCWDKGAISEHWQSCDRTWRQEPVPERREIG